MSRVAKNPIILPKGVDASIGAGAITVKGAKGSLTAALHPQVEVKIESGLVSVVLNKEDRGQVALAGTTRANIANMVTGVSTGYEKKLSMVGVGYRAQAKGQVLNLSLGFSHPVDFDRCRGYGSPGQARS